MFEQKRKSFLLLLVAPFVMLAFLFGWLRQDIQTAAAEPAAVNNIIAVNTNADELNSDGDCSLREAIEAANTDTAVDACAQGNGWDVITLPAATYTIAITGTNEDGNATGDYDILDSLTISGTGADMTIIDGDQIDRIFDVNPNKEGAAFSVEAVQLTNGSQVEGGGIYQDGGALTIADSVLSHHAADIGGAIHIRTGVLQLLSSTIEYNTITDNGGAIYSTDSVLTIQDSTIYSNTAVQGGGVYAKDSALTLHNTAVLSNTSTALAGGPGGNRPGGAGLAIPNSDLIVEAGSEIAYNNANANGGGIASWDGNESVILIQDSSIQHNSGSRGGGISAEGALKITNSTVSFNQASSSGGGIVADQATVVIADSILNDNSTGGSGGAIDGYQVTIVVINSTLNRNSAVASGGAIDADEQGGLYIMDSVFQQNTTEEDGGAINTYYIGLFIERTAFYNNHADLNGGAIQLEDDEGAILDQVSIVGNTANQNGGGIMIDDGAGLELVNSTLSGNSAANFGGGIAMLQEDENYVQAINSTIVSNTAGVAGGGLYADFNSSAINSIIAANMVAGDLSAITANCYFGGNFSSGGHNIFNDSGDCAATRYDTAVSPADLFTTVLEPLADNGGPVLPDGSKLLAHALLTDSPAIDGADNQFCLDHDQVGNGRLQGNACDIGAMESSDSATLPSFTDNTITVNTSDDELNSDGDCSLREAIEAANTDTAVDNCTQGDGWDIISLPALTYTLSITDALIEEDSNQSGDLDILSYITIQGVTSATTIIDADSIDRVMHVISGTLRLQDATLTNGFADGSRDGGCMLVKNSLLIANDFTTASCRATDGAALDFRQSGTFLNNGLVIDNVATGDAVINVYDASGNINNTRVISNTAARNGIVYAGYGYLRLSNSQILSNTVTGRDGGVYVYVAGALIENTEIAYNRVEASDDGAAINIDEAGVWLKDSHLHHNYAEGLGGAIYGNTDAGLWMVDTIVEENNAGESGGALFIKTGFIQDSVIRNNTSVNSGGGLLANNFVIENSEISGNEAENSYGGGLEVHYGLFTNVTIENNKAGDAGGGIYGDHPVILLDSTVQNNSTTGAWSDGAGIYMDDDPLLVRNSLIYSNSIAPGAGTTSADGGGIGSCGGAIHLLNSTVSGNTNETGGGIASACIQPVFVHFSTIVSNTAVITGGGLYSNQAYDSSFIIQDSIVAGNMGATGLDDGEADCNVDGNYTFLGYALFGENRGCATDNLNDQTVNPHDLFTTVLEPLADNGGNTRTHALLKDSPAIDAGNPTVLASVTAYDQRGMGYARVVNGRSDIGAYEAATYGLTVNFTGTGSGSVTSDPAGISCESDCNETYFEGEMVTLTAVSDADSTFVGWSGDCTGTGSCVVTIDMAKNVTATFKKTEFYIFLPVILK